MIQDIFFNGKYLSEYGCVITERPERPFIRREYEKIPVPGRNGDLIIDNKCYKNFALTYKVETIPTLYDYKDIDEVLTDLRAWLLSSVEYQKLYDTELPEGFYEAFCSEISNAVPSFEDMYEFKITFDCKPFFYLDSGQEEITTTNRSITLYNEGNYIAYPKIRIVGTGAIQCYANGKYFEITDISPNVIIDSEKQIVYSSLLNDKSNLFSGTYPSLGLGTNSIIFSGSGFQSAAIQTRWCRF